MALFAKNLRRESLFYTRLIQDKHPHPFSFIIAGFGKLLCVLLRVTLSDAFRVDEVGYVQRLGLENDGRVPGTHCGLIVYYANCDEIYYLPGRRFLAFVNHSLDKTMPKEFVEQNGLPVGMMKESARSRKKRVFDLGGLLKQLS